MNDDFYSQFEHAFRGTRAEITARLKVYFPFIDPLLALYPEAIALDLGCGRGEWLEILRNKGFTALGVDLDDGMLADCRALNLNVRTQDAIAALSGLEDASTSIVSAFHLVEHIPFDVLRTLVSEAHRVLKPGGLLIMETPNPENIVVGSSSFYLDPTHSRPLPPGLLSFVPKYYGFLKTTVLRIQESPHLQQNISPTLLDVLGGASPDYAVIAQKSANTHLLKHFDSAFALDLGLTVDTLSTRYDETNQREIAALNAQHREIADVTAHAISAITLQTNERFDLAEHEIAALNAQHREIADVTAHAISAITLQTNERFDLAEHEIAALNSQISAVYSSTSWKVTRPLRALGTGLRQLKELFKNRQ